jgi:5-methylcytosine-specific restriction endonuclease McrBC regulatory subunit McrC
VTNTLLQQHNAIRVGDIVCDERGTPNAQFWSGSFEELGSDLEAIKYQHQQKRIQLEIVGSNVVIAGADRVGLVVLPSGRRIILRTKISGLKLIEWLIYLGEFPDFQSWSPIGNVVQSDSWQKVLARLFLYELQRVTKYHLRKNFVATSIDSSTVRGRVDWGKAASRPWELPRLPQRVRQRSFDMPSNQMLAAALNRVMLFQHELNQEDRSLFSRLRHEWADIANPNMDRHRIIQASLTAPPDGYRMALQLARLLLIGAAIDAEIGTGGESFTLSLSRIWEVALKRMCRDLSPTTGWALAKDDEGIRPWDDASGMDDPYRCMRADTLLARDGERWVLDAKYKRDFANEGRNDRFQMCAYAIGFRAARGTLVYPFQGRHPETYRRLLSEDLGGWGVLIDSIALPMAEGPETCRGQLLRLLNHDEPAGFTLDHD